MHFTKGTTVLSESASTALGGVIGKRKMLRDLGFSTDTNLSQACPVLTMGPALGLLKRSKKSKSEVHGLFVGLGCEEAFTDKVEMDLTIGKELVSLRKRESWFSE